METALRELRWYKLPLRLSNRRNQYAREHPLFIFKGIFKFACGLCDPPLSCDYLFHPVGQPLPGRVRRGQVYDLEVIFPQGDETLLQRFIDGVTRQLGKQPRNFDLESIGPAQCRALADVEAEVLPTLDAASDEVCLDFVTPLVFNSPDPLRPWLLEASGLIQLCTVHLARLYPQLPWPLDTGSLAGIQALPYFWENDAIWHRSKSQPPAPDGQHTRQKIEGFTGPLYLRGDWRRLLPLLLVCSELHTGYGKGDLPGLAAQRHARHPISNPQGAFRLRTGRTFFDRQIKDPARFQLTARELAADSDAAEELARSLDGGKAVATAMAAAVADGDYRPETARIFPIGKPAGGERCLALLGAADLIVHRTLHTMLAPVCDRMLEHASVGFRPGRSIDTARRLMNQAIQAGAAYAVRADIEAFFDELDWQVLETALRRALPRADHLTLAAIVRCIQMPAEQKGWPLARSRGVLQGSPLSPLLANLCLDTFDEEMARLGYRMIRYGDDFVVLTSSREEAERALADINVLLAPLSLRLNPEKTAVTPLDLGFTFLGLDVPSALSDGTLARSALRKTLYLKRPYAFTGIDGDSVVVRKDDELLARLPLHRVGEIVFLGDGAVSTRLLQRCASLRIPVSFCSPAGWYSSTLKPDSKSWFGLVAAHARRHDALEAAGRLAAARRLVEAKLRNYSSWLLSLPKPDAKQAARTLLEICRELNGATDVDAVRGYEGSGARLVFALVNRLGARPGFESPRRVPREKPDRFNTLLDMLYSLLFTRLNVLLRSQGLDPYLGFLHSPLDHYESLVCDLQEPFRCRMDRLALKLINRQEITADGFEQPQPESGRWRLTGDAVGVVIEAFEREEEVRLVGEPSTLTQLLAGQVLAIRQWAEGQAVEPAFFAAEILSRKRPKSQNDQLPP